MKKKFDKYWGKIEELNPLLLVTVLLDPRYKEPFLTVCFEMMCGNSEEATKHTLSVRKILGKLYKEYCKLTCNVSTQISSTTTQSSEDLEANSKDIDAYTLFHNLRKQKLKVVDNLDNKTEVDKYLVEACEDQDATNFDILAWRKGNACRYKILFQIARDVLAIPVSIVASELAFSTDGVSLIHLGVVYLLKLFKHSYVLRI